jgi:hypothetical protein
MACLYKRRKKFWISYYCGGKRIQKSLNTSDARVAQTQRKRIEYELSLGNFPMADELGLTAVLENFCEHLEATCMSFKNDINRLRLILGEVCESDYIGIKKQPINSSSNFSDKYANAHAKSDFVERLP